MNFRGGRASQDELEINLIPLIDVLLVILIFLAATTSFARFTQLKVVLPEAAAEQEARRRWKSPSARTATTPSTATCSTPPTPPTSPMR